MEKESKEVKGVTLNCTFGWITQQTGTNMVFFDIEIIFNTLWLIKNL